MMKQLIGSNVMSRMMIAAGLGAVMILGSGCLVLGDDILNDEKEQGFTECGDFLADLGDNIYCQPGQYCDDPTFSECLEGCLSNENCAEDQRCVKADGDQVGSCQAEIKRPASNPRNTGVSEGLTECGTQVGSNEANYCQPNQYCKNASFARCELGCLSDSNCAEEQECVKADGEDIGSCQRAE